MKGIVSNTELHRLCDKLRDLLADRANVRHEQDWDRLQEYTQLIRRFTTVEARRIEYLHMCLRSKRTQNEKV